MRYILFPFVLLLFSCDKSLKSDTANQFENHKTGSIKSSTPIYDFHIQLDKINNEFVFHVQRDTFEQTTRLKTYDIAWSSPQVLWTSDAFACILTFSSGQYGEYAFLPLRSELIVKVVKGGMIETDSVNNFILYTDTAIQNHYTLAFENLLTQKKKTFKLTSYNHDGFKPILDTVILRKQEAIIMDGNKKYKVDLKEINGT
ncbi:hypothetical protein [Paracnuella aquatica]|uniref:hypothetical protein n=1 Tax=Paracnuella aquatica TaxID=2268757 RepID=UPI000F4DC542|nr:hypothetical protein [Paracnuella aquatica]RPD43406.1 hypothetical protein DRJ53_20355 [Paracnuella aquatica]